jgi:hypothetical protein
MFNQIKLGAAADLDTGGALRSLRRFRCGAWPVTIALALTMWGSKCRGETRMVLRMSWGMWTKPFWLGDNGKVRAEKRRIRELAIQRRLRAEIETVGQPGAAGFQARIERHYAPARRHRRDRQASFIFTGNADEDWMSGDFVPVEPKRP